MVMVCVWCVGVSMFTFVYVYMCVRTLTTALRKISSIVLVSQHFGVRDWRNVWGMGSSPSADFPKWLRLFLFTSHIREPVSASEFFERPSRTLTRFCAVIKRKLAKFWPQIYFYSSIYRFRSTVLSLGRVIGSKLREPWVVVFEFGKSNYLKKKKLFNVAFKFLVAPCTAGLINLFSSRFSKTVCPCGINFVRRMSSSEIATALRPFYFSVHPDLFGQYPSERVSLCFYFS